MMDPNIRETLRAWLQDSTVRARITAGDLPGLVALTDPGPLAPHIVPVPAAVVVNGAHVGEPRCPDCGRGLTSRGTDLICPQLPMRTPLSGVLSTGRVVACGVS